MHMSFKQLVFRPDTVVNLLEAQFEDQCATGADLKAALLLQVSSGCHQHMMLISPGGRRGKQPACLRLLPLELAETSNPFKHCMLYSAPGLAYIGTRLHTCERRRRAYVQFPRWGYGMCVRRSPHCFLPVNPA